MTCIGGGGRRNGGGGGARRHAGYEPPDNFRGMGEKAFLATFAHQRRKLTALFLAEVAMRVAGLNCES